MLLSRPVPIIDSVEVAVLSLFEVEVIEHLSAHQWRTECDGIHSEWVTVCSNYSYRGLGG